MKKTPKEKGLSLKETIADIKSMFGEDAIMTLDEKPYGKVEVIPTGSIGLDIALGVGGVPKGRIVEIFGPEASGKTTLALHIVAEAQKLDGICAYIDAEHALDLGYSKRLGVKTTDLLLSQPSGGEEALRIADSLVRSGKVAVVVIDSVSELVPKAELEGQIGDAQVAGQARLMSQAMRMLTAPVAKTNTLLIFINQLRTNMNLMGYGGNPETTSGGRALKYAASVRLDIRRIATLKKGEEAMGSRIRVKVAKNKVATPFKSTEFDIIFNEGISREGELLNIGEQAGVVTKSGNSYLYGEVKIGRGYDSARQFLKENPKIAEEILSNIKN